MVTYFCPKCWNEIDKSSEKCPHCGYHLEGFSHSDYEEKLLEALHHTIPERRIMAAQVLGNRGSLKAIPEFDKLVNDDETNFFFLRAVLLATFKINHPARVVILERAAHHPSALVANLARELLEKLDSGVQLDTWDRNTA